MGVAARAGLLLVVGLLLGRVESPPLVILAYYALLFLVAVPFLGLGARTLALLAVGSAVLAPGRQPPAARAAGPVSVVEEPGGGDLLVDLFLTGTYPVLTWTAYLFAGLALGRAGLTGWLTPLRVVVVGAALALGAKATSAVLLSAVGGSDRLDAGEGGLFLPVDAALRSGLFGTTPTADWRWLTVSAPHSGTTFDLAHTIGTSMVVLGGFLLLARLVPRVALLPLAAVGSMTFTLYSLHVLALAQDSPLLLDDPAQLWWAHVVVAVVLATAWRTTLGRGPLEALAAWLDATARRLAGGRREREPVASRT